MTGTTDVVVIGGGYAGVMAANRLTSRDGIAVTLINPRPAFVERIRLHQLAAGSDDALVDYATVLNAGVRLVVDEVTRIDAARRTLVLASGGELGYDHLVYAVGSGSTPVPGAAEHAHPIATFESAGRLATALQEAPDAAVTVVGAGPAGLETATELAEAGRRVTLVCGGVLGPYLHPRARRSLARRLARLGVTVVDGPGTQVTSVGPGAVELADGRTVPSGVTIWAAGFGVPDLAARSGLSTDALGRLRTDETLTSVDDDRIVATGDAASPSGLPYRMSCQAAVQLGWQAAETVLSRIAGTPAAPVTAGFVGECMSLGRGDGLVQFARRDDTAVGVWLSGRAAARLKEFVCRSTISQLAREARRPGAGQVRMTDPHRREQLAARRREAPVSA